MISNSRLLFILFILFLTACPKKVELNTVYLANNRIGLDKILNRIKQGRPTKIICYGDSVTFGANGSVGGRVKNPYPAVLEKMLRKFSGNHGVSVKNEGYGGWTTRDALINLNKKVILKKPDISIVMFGINDAITAINIDEYENNLRKITKRILRAGCTVILIASTPIINSRNDRLILYIKRVKKVADENSTPFFNIHYEIVKKFKSGEERAWDFIPDGIHPGDNKYEVLAEIIYRFIADKSL